VGAAVVVGFLVRLHLPVRLVVVERQMKAMPGQAVMWEAFTVLALAGAGLRQRDLPHQAAMVRPVGLAGMEHQITSQVQPLPMLVAAVVADLLRVALVVPAVVVLEEPILRTVAREIPIRAAVVVVTTLRLVVPLPVARALWL
jgi:hypothetical protein